MAAAALGVGGWWLAERRTAAASGLLRARLRNLSTQLEPGTVLALRVRTRLAMEEAAWTGRADDVLVALAEARRSADPLARAEALRLAHHALLGPDHGRLLRTLADELVGEAGRGRGRGHLLMGLLYQTVDLFLDGDPHAHRRLAELRAQLEQGEHQAVGYVTGAVEVMLTIRAGRLDEAERLARECHARGVALGDVNAAAWYAAQLGAIRWYQGRVAEVLPMLGELIHSPELSSVDDSVLAAHAVAAAAAGDHRAAARTLAGLLHEPSDGVPRSGTWLVTMYCCVEAANLIGDRQAAVKAYELLGPYAGRPMMATIGVACFGSVEHALGVAALTSGDVDRAVKHLERAVPRNLALGHAPAVLYSRLRQAEALERRRGPGDVAAAAAERDQAVESATGLQAAANHATGARSARASCTRHGRRWRVEFGGRVVHLQHRVGMLHPAVLLANPGAEITALDLVAGVEGLAGASRGAPAARQPVLDRTADRQYRRRLAELPEGSPERAWLLAELAAGTGMRGRARAFADDAERARLAVGRAIRRAVAAVEQADQVLGSHLRGCVHTGARCWYRPI